MAEHNAISIHEVRIFLALTASGGWLTNHEIAAAVSDVAPRTVRAHTLKLVQAGLVDQAVVFPGHRYRIAAKASKRNQGYLQRLMQAAEVFGLKK